MFELVSSYTPSGDQPQAIAKLVEGVKAGERHQTLLGVTGSGKTFTIANVIAQINKPTLIISHNKTLAAQLYAEFKGFFPHNAVEYFISYFDFYQPEAYIPQTDTFIEKDSSINDEIERMRLAAMSSLFSREDVIVVASVSCIYGLGSREEYEEMLIQVRRGQIMDRDAFLERLVELLYARNDIEFGRGAFRVRGDVVELFPAWMQDAFRFEFFGDEIERISRCDPLTGETFSELESVTIFPAKQFVTSKENLIRATKTIKTELNERLEWFEQHGKLLEAQRLKSRTEYDIEMMLEMGFCSGIENYSRHITGRPPGSKPCTLIDFFPKDYLLIIDESHVTVPQIGGMSAGDRSRKTVLVDYGFRLPSALDNRPLRFEEFQAMQGQTIYLSATPSPRELEWSHGKVVEQIVRPTGLVDPEVFIRPLKGQIDDLIEEIRKRAEKHERVFVTTLTKRTAEKLTDYLRDIGINVQYLHSEIDAIERVEILRALRRGDFDVLVGINLLREGLDVPEVSLVAILDADKEGFLRSATSLIQTAGRAARNVKGQVILYCDVMTDSIKKFLAVSEYRRKRQMDYNKEHGITPKSVSRPVEEGLLTASGLHPSARKSASVLAEEAGELDLDETIAGLRDEMVAAARELLFEKAALIRDQIRELERMKAGGKPSEEPEKYKPPLHFRRGVALREAKIA
ncbi:MAG: excinuclease ABC subunit UvrB, partial [Verrucomicrobia bacterium]|nr:excinuclease ABC subunit UvrB [Verrucomicrobiota bacterium]